MRTSLLLLVVLAACPAPAPVRPTQPTPTTPAPDGGDPPTPPGAPAITVTRIQTVADLPEAPLPGSFHIHMIDVGTGLAMLIRGADFALLYDAGTNDAAEKPMRVIAYLAAALGPSGDSACVESGAQAPTKRVKIDHVVLSHPHFDHASALDEVLYCYDVGAFWDSGAINDAVFYRELLSMIGKSPLVYRTASDVPSDHKVTVKGLSIEVPKWERFSEGDPIHLGEGAKATILHANPKAPKSNLNEASIVLAVELGRTKLLLVGDAESGGRKDPSYPADDVEKHLIDHHAAAIKSDILQVGHHGSKTSSRREFLDAVKPRYALVSTGPKAYSGTTLPDVEVMEELVKVGARVIRTDEHDGKCPLQGRIGGDKGEGGCDSYVITIGP